jgi:hypothetical protein
MNQLCFADNPYVKRDQRPTIEGLVSGKPRTEHPDHQPDSTSGKPRRRHRKRTK